MGLLGCSIKYIAYFVAFAGIIVLIPNLPPHIPIHFDSYTPAFKLEGKLSPSNILDRATVLQHELFNGCESLAVGDEGADPVVYTGTVDGKILRINEKTDEVSVVTTLGKNVDGKFIPNRPIGMRLFKKHLYVATLFNGVMKIDPATGKAEELFSVDKLVDGQRPDFANDLDVAEDGSVYWSHPIARESKDFVEILLGNEEAGRLLRYDPKTKENTVLMDNVSVANGVTLSEKQDFVLVAEIRAARILRYYLKGEKKGTRDVFIDGLPGLPDNLRRSGKGTIYVSLVCSRRLIPDFLGPLPLLRKFLLRTRSFLLTRLSPFLPEFVTEVIQAHWIFDVMPIDGLVLEISEKGELVRSFQSTNGKVFKISQFTPAKHFAYVSSPWGDKMWKLPLSELN